MGADARAEALRALSRFLVTDVSLGDALQKVADLTTAAIQSADVAGISMLGADGQPTTAIYTDEASPGIDAAQYESGRGPCLDAWRTGNVVRVDDMDSAAGDYPEFARAAREHGIGSVMSLPLAAAEHGIGAMNLYSRRANAFSSDDETVGLDLATAAAAVLANSSAYWSAAELGEQLTHAMRSRAVIEQAKGMLMAQSPTMTADEAFAILRMASQRENVKLRDIAQRIVDRRPMSGHGNV
jgi:transcriptional regulator with GAF, ATPase, and Fis domain